MFRKSLITVILIMVVTLALGNLAFADDINPALPQLKLSIEQSPAIYPPYTIYTAQLSFVPAIITNQLVADFYNINTASEPPKLEYLGSAPFDNTGKAVFVKQMKPGYYVGIAKTVINGITIWSNKVEYKVR